LLDFPLKDMNNRFVYLDMETCRNLFDLPERVTSVIIMVDNPYIVDRVIHDLKPHVAEDLRVFSWKEIQEELENLIEGKLASGKIVKAVLFMVIGFGIWGTIIMLMNERRRELGIMVAVGVRKIRLIWIVAIESFFIGLLGVITGSVLSFPLVFYLFKNPIYVTGDIAQTYTDMGFEPVIKFGLHPDIFINPAITVFILFTVLALYPVIYIRRLKTVEALRA